MKCVQLDDLPLGKLQCSWMLWNILLISYWVGKRSSRQCCAFIDRAQPHSWGCYCSPSSKVVYVEHSVNLVMHRTIKVNVVGSFLIKWWNSGIGDIFQDYFWKDFATFWETNHSWFILAIHEAFSLPLHPIGQALPLSSKNIDSKILFLGSPIYLHVFQSSKTLLDYVILVLAWILVIYISYIHWSRNEVANVFKHRCCRLKFNPVWLIHLSFFVISFSIVTFAWVCFLVLIYILNLFPTWLI